MPPLHMNSPADLKAALGRQAYAEEGGAELDGRGYVVHRTRETPASSSATPRPTR